MLSCLLSMRPSIILCWFCTLILIRFQFFSLTISQFKMACTNVLASPSQRTACTLVKILKNFVKGPLVLRTNTFKVESSTASHAVWFFGHFLFALGRKVEGFESGTLKDLCCGSLQVFHLIWPVLVPWKFGNSFPVCFAKRKREITIPNYSLNLKNYSRKWFAFGQLWMTQFMIKE